MILIDNTPQQNRLSCHTERARAARHTRKESATQFYVPKRLRLLTSDIASDIARLAEIVAPSRPTQSSEYPAHRHGDLKALYASPSFNIKYIYTLVRTTDGLISHNLKFHAISGTHQVI